MNRDIEPVLLHMLWDKRQDVIVVEAARQVGKSTLVKQVLTKLPVDSVAIDLEKDRKVARLIDKTLDFEDFRALMRDQCADLFGDTFEFAAVCQECDEGKMLKFLKLGYGMRDAGYGMTNIHYW